MQDGIKTDQNGAILEVTIDRPKANAIDLAAEIPDLHRLEQVSATLAAKARSGEPALPILVAGSVRVLPASCVRVGS